MKKWKWTLGLFLCMVMALTMMSSVAFAAEIVDNGTCGENLTWTLDDEGTLRVEGTGAMENFPSWLENHRGEIKTAIISEGVTNISVYGFHECKNLESVTIPDSVTILDEDAFYGCVSLESLKIPDNVTRIGEWAFYGCVGLKTVEIPDSVTSIDQYAFHSCRNLESIKIPKGVTTISYMAFCECDNLTSAIIPDGVTSIDQFAFQSCKSLENIAIPASVTHIYNMSFYACTALKSLTFLGDAPTIDEDTFLDVTATAYYPEDNDTWKDVVDKGYGGTLTWEATHLVHTPEIIPGKEATCMKDGLTDGENCAVCGLVLVEQEVIPAEGHTGEWMDNSEEATCIKKGIKEGVACSVCGKVMVAPKELPINPDNHKNIVVDEAKAATYTETGLTEGSHCADCGKVLKEQSVTPMLTLAEPVITSVTNGNTAISLKWNEVTGAIGYEIYRKAGSATTWTLAKTITSGSTVSWSDTNRTNGTKYQYKIVATADTNKSADSAVKTMYRLSRPALTTGTKNIATKKIVVKWNKNTKATGYQVKYVKGSTTKTVKVKGASTLSKTLSSLSKGSTYKVYVRSYKTVGSTTYYSAYSAYKSVKVVK